MTCKETPVEEEAPKTGSLKTWEGNEGSHFSFRTPHPTQVFRWLAPKWNFQTHPKGKEKALSKRKSKPLANKHSLLRHCHPTDSSLVRAPAPQMSSFSKSIKPACVKLTQNIKPTGFFLLEIRVKVCGDGLFQQELQWGSISDLRRRRDLKKHTQLTGEGRDLGQTELWNLYMLISVTTLLFWTEIQAKRSSQEPLSIQSLGIWFELLLNKKR